MVFDNKEHVKIFLFEDFPCVFDIHSFLFPPFHSFINIFFSEIIEKCSFCTQFGKDEYSIH